MIKYLLSLALILTSVNCDGAERAKSRKQLLAERGRVVTRVAAVPFRGVCRGITACEMRALNRSAALACQVGQNPYGVQK